MKKFLSFILTLCGVFALGGLISSQTVSAAQGDAFKVVKNVSELTNGKKIILVSEDVAAGAWNSNKQYLPTPVTPGDTIIVDGSVTIFELGVAGTEYTLKDLNKNQFMIYSGDSTDLALSDTSTNNWTISIATSGIATIKPVTSSNAKRCLKFNPNLKAYASSSNVKIYAETVLGTTYNVSFLDTDKQTQVLNTLTVEENNVLDLSLQIPNKPGYVFAGWFNKANDEKVNDSLTVTGNVELYAKWTESKLSQITTDNMATELVSAKYMLKTVNTNLFNGGFDSYHNRINSVASEALASEIVILKFADGYVLGVYNANGNLRYLKNSSSTDLDLVENLSDATKVQITIDPTGVAKLAVQLDRFILHSADGYFKAYKEGNKYENVILYKINGSNISNNLKFVVNNLETKSSLKIQNVGSVDKELDVDLRFGGIIPTEVYKEGLEYGVIVLQNATIDSLTKAELEAYKTSQNVVVADKIAQLANGYQYAWVITNMEGHYEETLNAYMYVLDGENVYLSKVKSASAKSTAEIYVDQISSGSLVVTPELQGVLETLAGKTATPLA